MANSKSKIIAFTIEINGVSQQLKNLGDVQKALKEIIKERDILSRDGGLDLANPADLKRFDEINSKIATLKSTITDVNKGIGEMAKQTSLVNQDVRKLSGSYNDLRNQTSFLTKLAKQLGENIPTHEWVELKKAIGAVIPEVLTFTHAELASGKAIETVQKQISANNEKLRDFDRAISGNNTLVGEYTRGIADFFKQFGGTDILKKKLSDLTAEEVRLKKEAEALVIALKNAQQGTETYEKLEQQIKEVSKQLDKASTEMNNINSAMGKTNIKGQLMQGIFTGISTVLAEFGLNSVIDTFQKVISLNVQMDQTLARVAKTTQLTKEQSRLLNRELRNIDTGTAEEELRQMAIVAGKLGIEGVDNIRDFVEATDRIKVALGSELGQDTEATLERLAKIVNIFGLGQDYPFAEAVERVGSAVNYLADAGAASSSGLVDFTRRLAGVAPIANISVTDILGFGSALEELGQTSEVSGTAMTRLIINLGKNVPYYAKIAGVSVEEFSKLVREDANEAMLLLIEKSKSSKEGVEGLARTLGALEINGVRVATVFGALANNIELVRRRQEEAGTAFEKNTYLAKAFKEQSDTLGASFSKLGKNIAAFVLSEQFTDTLKGWVLWINNYLAARNKMASEDYKVKKVLKETQGGESSFLFGKHNFEKQEEDLKFILAVINNITRALDNVSDEEGFQKVINDLRKYKQEIADGNVQNLEEQGTIRAAVRLTEDAITEVIQKQGAWTQGIVKTRKEQAAAYEAAHKEAEADVLWNEKQAAEEKKAADKLERERKKAEAEAKKARKEAAEGSIEDLKKQIKDAEEMLTKTTDEKRQIEIILNIIELKEQLKTAEDALVSLRAKYERKKIEVLELPTIGDLESGITTVLDELGKKLKPKPIKLLEPDLTIVYESAQRTIEENMKFIEETIKILKKDIADNRESANPFFNFQATIDELDQLELRLSVLKLLSLDFTKLDEEQLDLAKYNIIDKVQEIRNEIVNLDEENVNYGLAGAGFIGGAITQLGLLQAVTASTKESMLSDIDQLLAKLEEFRLTGLGKELENLGSSFGYMSAAMGSVSSMFKEGSKEAQTFMNISKKLAAVQNIVAQSLLIVGIAQEASKGVFGIAQMFALIAAFASAMASASSLFVKFGEGGDLDSKDGHLLPKQGRGMVRGNKSHASGDDIAVNYKGKRFAIESGEALVDVIGADGKPRKFVLSKRTMSDPVLRTILESVNYRIANARNSIYGGVQQSVFATGGEIKPNVGGSTLLTAGGGITPEQVQAIIDAQLSKLMIVNNVVDADKVLTDARKNSVFFEG